MNYPDGAINEKQAPYNETEHTREPLPIYKVCDCGGILKAHGLVNQYYKCDRCEEVEFI